VHHWLRFWRSAQNSRYFEAKNIVAIPGFIQVVATSFDLLPDLVSLHHVVFGLLEVLKVEDQIPLVAAEAKAKGEA
jgi:hypothetical protein